MAGVAFALAFGVALVLAPTGVLAQTSAAPPPRRPWGRVSFVTNTARTAPGGGETSSIGELSTSFSYHLPEHDDRAFEYSFDIRHSTYPGTLRSARVSIYEAFVGARLASGRVRVRAGQLWLRDLGGLGSVGGGAVEWLQPRADATAGRFRAGVFGGLEPRVLEAGFATHIRKAGGYLTYEGRGARRHTVGYVNVRNRTLTERSVLTTTNFWPVARKLFIYQAMDYDLKGPAGQAARGLAYFFMTTRLLVTERLELQGTYNRGHSVDVRGLSENILAGRPVSQSSVEGLLFQSAGGRATLEVLPRVRVFGGYSTDKNSRDSARSSRILVGGHASNVAGSGWNVSASDTLSIRSTGRHHTRYVSAGHAIGRAVYASIDYNTSLAVVRFSRTDGVVVETRPHTRRWAGMGSIILPRALTLNVTAERTRDDDYAETRVLAGLSYRIR